MKLNPPRALFFTALAATLALESLRAQNAPAQNSSAAQPEPKRETEIHLRFIQLSRSANQSDDSLLTTAAGILKRFHAGESFAELAKKHSDDQRRARGGDWGWLKRSDFKPDLGEIIFRLKAGEASEPVIRPEGCFIFYVEARR